MPNQIDADGLQTETLAEITAALNAALEAIYGVDINLDSDTPDGQLIGIFAQAVLDNLDLLTQVYNGFNPDLAIGTTLDQRCAINGIQRQAGTYTKTNITLTLDRALSLDGLDGDSEDPNGEGYTVSDNAGNQWILLTSESFGSSGTYARAFRSKNAGAVLTTPNTITTPVTIVLGVTAVNNPTTYTTLGIDEETDAQLRIRRQKSVALSSQGFLQGLLAALLNISGVTAAFVYENNGPSTDADSIPSHSIWVIVNGGAAVDIATAIYRKRNAGAGMKGSQTYDVTQTDGTIFTVKWDNVTAEDVYIKVHITSMNGIDSIDSANIKTEIAARLAPGVYERLDVNELATLVQGIDPNALCTFPAGDGFGYTGGGTFYTNLLPSAKNKQFTIDSTKITITVV